MNHVQFSWIDHPLSSLFSWCYSNGERVVLHADTIEDKAAYDYEYLENLTMAFQSNFKNEVATVTNIYNRHNYDTSFKIPFKFENHSFSTERAFVVSNEGHISDVDVLGSRAIARLLNPKENIDRIQESFNHLSLETCVTGNNTIFFITRDFSGNTHESPKDICNYLTKSKHDYTENKLAKPLYRINSEIVEAINTLSLRHISDVIIPISKDDFRSKCDNETFNKVETIPSSLPHFEDIIQPLFWGSLVTVLSICSFSYHH